MHRLTGGHAVVEQLEREGVDVAFGIPGVHNLELYDALVDGHIDHVTARHEQGVGFMADGYARTTGRVGVALVITGPGLTNVATAVGQSYSDSSPMLVISTANAVNEGDRGKGMLHELKDQQGVMESIAAYSERVERVSDIPGAVADAFSYLESHRPRPVHLEIPTDVLEREEQVELVDRAPVSPPAPDADRLDEAADRLVAADQPVLVVGGGTVEVAETVRRFVDETGLPVVTTTAGKGVVPASHDACLGTTVGSDAAESFLASRDVALAVGTELSEQETGGVPFPEELIHVDIDYTNLAKNHPTAMGIVGDAEQALAGIQDRLATQGFTPHESGAAVESAEPAPLAATADEDNRHAVLSVLRESLDDDAVVVNDMTKLCYEGRNRFPMEEPGSFHFPMGYGTLGFSPPAAFGAAVGTNRQVVGLVGDGGFIFTVGDLATAVKYDIGVPIVVLNDDSYDILEDVQRAQYGRTMATDIENPDFVALAEGFGAAGQRVEFEELEAALPAALSAAFDRDQPTVIEIPVEF
ncbi:MAG: thiamine pyrophosphate-binding protein [Halolamina sp.]